MAFRQSLLTEATLYKFRYFLGYGFLICLLLFIITVDIDNLPTGISQAEMQNAVASNQLSFRLSLDWVVNAPYHALQKLSIMTFGLSRTALVLPSIIFGSATIILFTLTMRKWFRDSVAVVTTVIAVTTASFVGMIRSGTPDIMLSFWTILLLFAAVRFLIGHHKAFTWKVVMVIAATGLLYTPFGIYPVLALVASGLIHPHVRSKIRHIKRKRIFILTALGFTAITPLVIHLVLQPSSLLVLSGFDVFGQALDNMKGNLRHLFDLYLNFTQNNLSGTRLTPIFGVASAILMLLGLFKVIKDRHTARSYALLSWALMVAVITLLAPNEQSLVLMPALLLLAIGIDTLVVDWYNLFPKNPYARFAGLIPLSILFVGIAIGNASHYFYTYRYTPNDAYAGSLSSIRSTLDAEAGKPMTLVTDANAKDFYNILQRKYPNLAIVTSTPITIDQPTMIIPGVKYSYTEPPSRIITSHYSEKSVLLRLYRPQ